MGPSWAHAFVGAALLTLAGTPLLRRMALATDFVDNPEAAHKSHEKAIPYLGGIGLMVGVLVGLLFTSQLTPQVKVIAVGGPLIGCLGLLDDHRSVGPLLRFLIELGVAAVVLAFGLRIHATDIVAIDAVVTLIWIVGVTNAVNLLDNMDGLAAGVASAAAVAIFGLAVLGEQPGTAVLSAGLAGACVGFLAYNKRPASIFMGDAGSLFLGFVLAVATIDVSPALSPPGSFVVPLMLLALPVLDTTTVTVSRLRRGRSIALGGKDHLSHRLVARKRSPGTAVGILISVEGLIGVFAVLAGRDVVPLAVAVLAAAAVLALLAVYTAGAPVYDEAVVGLPRKLKLAAAAAAGAIGVLAAPGALALVRAHGPGVAAAGAAKDGLDALAAGDAARATALFRQSIADFDRAQSILDNRLNSVGLVIPGLRVNLAASRAVVKAGRQVADAASELSSVAEASTVPLGGAADPVGAIAGLAPALEASAATMYQAAGQLGGFDRPYLWPSMDTTVRQLRDTLLRQAAAASQAAAAGRLLPAMLGQDGTRRYFLAVQDNAERRATGGVVHTWGELVAENGRLRLAHLGPIDELDQQTGARTLELPPDLADRYRQFDIANTWQNVNVSPDAAATGRIITQLYPQVRGTSLDGVITVDLAGLAALVDLTGPIRVDGWAEPITGGNLVDVLLRDSYQRIPAPDAHAALADRVVETTVRSFLTTGLGTASRVAHTLSAAAAGGHLSLYATRPAEQVLARQFGASGEMGAVNADSLLVVTQNLTATAVDSYLHRNDHYDVTLAPGGSSASITGRLDLTFRNDAPAAGVAPAVIGPVDSRFAAGENRSYLSVYSPLAVSGATLDGDRAAVVSSPEFGRTAHAAIVDIPSKQTRTVSLAMSGKVGLAGGDWYHLDLGHQTSLTPDDTRVSIAVPKGWRITATEGVRLKDPRHAEADLRLTGPQRLSVRVERTAWSRFWHPTKQRNPTAG